MFGTTDRVRGGRRVRPAQASHSRRPVLEELESRNLLSATFGEGIGVKGDVKALMGLYDPRNPGNPLDLVTRVSATGPWTLVSDDGRFTTYDARNGSRIPYSVTDADNIWNLTGTKSPAQDALVDAQFYAKVTADFYFGKFGFTIAPVLSVGHYGRSYGDAFYNGTYVLYGDGNGTTTRELSGAVDVVGHELSHSVTNQTSQLIYANESGALNEAFSDIMGTAIEWYRGTETANGKQYVPDWYLGEDVYINPNATTSHGARDMSDPAFFVGKPDHYSEYVHTNQDNGGVHTNSNIVNHAFYLLAQDVGTVRFNAGEARGHNHPGDPVSVTGIGMEAAVQIFFHGFTSLPSNATFSVARNATVQAALERYGATISGYVSDAWAAVGVTATSSAGSTGGNSNGPAGLTADSTSEEDVLAREGTETVLRAARTDLVPERPDTGDLLPRLLISAGFANASVLLLSDTGLTNAKAPGAVPVLPAFPGKAASSDLPVARCLGSREDDPATFAERATVEKPPPEMIPGADSELAPAFPVRNERQAEVSDLVWLDFSEESPLPTASAESVAPGAVNEFARMPLALTTLVFGGYLGQRVERYRRVGARASRLGS